MNIDLQKFLYSNPSRTDLMNYQSLSSNRIKIGVYRNHSFELIEHTISPYLDYADISAEFVYSDYDDSLSFINLDTSTHLLIVWLDANRYKNIDFNVFLTQRLYELKRRYKRPILVSVLDSDFVFQDNQITVYNLKKFHLLLDKQFYDLRLEKFSGTIMSAALCLMVARDLGLNYIPALVKPGIKAIVVDLDNTLYEGVLGEDGIDGLLLSAGHRKLQTVLKRFTEQGKFLCIASKNNNADVYRMFEQRTDFPLKLNDFTKICCSWDSKAESIQEIANFLNIGIDSILFIDDNPGELFSVARYFTDIHGILAQKNAYETCEVVENFPGLLKLGKTIEDTIRLGDTKANDKRKRMKAILSQEDYLRSLEIQLVFSINKRSQTERISELSNKTNQFIFNYKRYSIAQVQDLMENKNVAVISVSLSDRLSDSGLIAVCIARAIDDYVRIEECFVSCRALGRGIDEIIVLGAISYAQQILNKSCVKVLFQRGERNLPADNFIKLNLCAYTQHPAPFSYKIPECLLTVKVEKDV